MDIREEFEKLSGIAERVDDGWISFRNGAYWNKCLQRSDDFLNGAWYAFQEQQKKKDLAISKIKAFEKNTSADQVLFLNDLLIELKVVLK